MKVFVIGVMRKKISQLNVGIVVQCKRMQQKVILSVIMENVKSVTVEIVIKKY
jgi:hypothetical protein